MNVALTGNVASGKSVVARVWREAGAQVVDADDLARQAVAPGTKGLAAIVRAFGKDMLDDDGSLDRARMRDLVFSDAGARARLESIIHPLVWELRKRWLAERATEGHALVVSEIPLLFETGREGDFDVIVFVDAPSSARMERLVSDRGLEAEQARLIMDAQMDAASKRARSHRVLSNDADLDTLRDRALALMETLRRAAGPPPPLLPPDPELCSAGRMRLDLHLHTRGSWDCLSDPAAVLERASVRGIERIAVTDHNELGVALELAERFPERVIPGEEVKTAEGIDVIGLYLTEVIPKGTSARETCERIRDQGGLVYLPHPYARGKGGSGAHAETLAPLIDVVEVFNARLHPARLNAPAEGLAARWGKLRAAGSDAHTLGEVAGAYVEVPRHANRADELRKALSDVKIFGATAANAVHLASTWAKIRRRHGRHTNPSAR